MRALLSLIITFLILNASFTLSAPVDTTTTTTNSPSPSASEDPFPLPSPAIIGGGDEPSDGFVYLCQWTGFLQCYKYTWVAQKCNKVSKGLELIKSIVVTEGKTCSLFSNDKCIGPGSGVITGPIKEIQTPVECKSWMCWCNNPASCVSEGQSEAREVRDVLEPVLDVELVERDSNAAAEVAMYLCEEADFGQCQLFQFVKQTCIKIPDYMTTINSAIPVPGTYCTLYSDDTCTGESTLPIITNVKQVGPEVVARKSFVCDCSDPEGCPLSSKKRELEDKSVSVEPLTSVELVERDGGSAAPAGFIYLCREPGCVNCELYPWNVSVCGKVPSNMPVVRSVIMSAEAQCNFYDDKNCHFPLRLKSGPITENIPDLARHAKSWDCECKGLKACPHEQPTKRGVNKRGIEAGPEHIRSAEPVVSDDGLKLAGRDNEASNFDRSKGAEIDNKAQKVDGEFALCAGSLWGGGCSLFPWTNKECYPVANSATPWVQSASPTQENHGHCLLFRDEQCKGETSPTLVYPGLALFENDGVFGPWKSWSCRCGDDGQCPLGSSNKREIEASPDRAERVGSFDLDENQQPQGLDIKANASDAAELDDPVPTPDGWFAMCPKALWGGGCTLYPWMNKDCYRVPKWSLPSAHSASPTTMHSGHCYLFRDDACKGDTSPVLVYPGLKDFSRAGVLGPWNSRGCLCGELGGACPHPSQ